MVTNACKNCTSLLWHEKDIFILRSKESSKKQKKQSEEEASKSKGSKDYHYYRYCPLQGCISLVKRLPPHLAKVDKLPPDEFKRTLSKVAGKRVRDSHRVPIHERRLQHSNRFQDESDHPSVLNMAAR